MDSEQTRLAKMNFDYTEQQLDSVLNNEVSKGSVEETGAVSGEEVELAEEEADKDPPPFDIHLRESLRILADAVEYSPNPRDWTESETLTAQRAQENAGALR